MPSGNKGRSDTDNYYRSLAEGNLGTTEAAITKASNPDELEARRRSRALELDKWETGELGPVDVRNMPGGDVGMALFRDANSVHDAGRKGVGVRVMAGNANPAYLASLDKEQEMERHKLASGMLENYVTNKLAAKDAEMGELSQVANARNLAIAGMRENRYNADRNRELTYLMRQKRPNFFRQLAEQFAYGAGSGASAAAGA